MLNPNVNVYKNHMQRMTYHMMAIRIMGSKKSRRITKEAKQGKK